MQPPTVFVINLDNRPDRWLNLQKICWSNGIQPIRISAVKASPGWHGCAKSHAKCAAKAKEMGLPWVLVLEDDCTFSREGWQRFLSFLPWLWNNRDKWEFFNGGITYVDKIEVFNEKPLLLKANGYAAHFILYTDAAYDYIAGWDEKSHGPCDTYFDVKFKSVACYPLIARQIPNHSDINDSSQDYTGFFNSTEDKMREFLQQHNLLDAVSASVI